MTSQRKLNLGKVYFLYLFFMLFLQIIGISSKGTAMDTLWKAGVIAITMLHVLYKSRFSIPRYLIIPLLIYVLGQVAAVCVYPVNMASASMFTVVTNVAIIISMVYLFLALPYVTEKFEPDDMTLYINAFIVLMLYAVVYNFVVVPDAVMNVFSNKSVYEDMMSSFFDNKQTFGMFLFMAFMCAVLQYVRLRRNRYLAAALLFFVNLFICLSRTALFSCLFFVAMLCIFLWNKGTGLPKKIFFAAGVILAAIAFVPNLRIFLEDVVLDTEATMNARQDIWSFALKQIKGPQWIFGYMDGNAAVVLQEGGRIQYSHNGIVQVLITGGAIKLILYVLIVVKCIKTMLRIKKYDPVLSAVFISIFCGIMMYSMGEAIVLFDTSAWCVAATILCVALPCAVDGYYIRNAANGEGE